MDTQLTMFDEEAVTVRPARKKSKTYERSVEKFKSAAIIAACNYDNPLGEPAYGKNFYNGFMAGADYALANQWIKPADGMPEDRQRILICYQSYHNGRYLRLFAEEIYHVEEGIFSGVVKPDNVIAWMAVPEMPY